MSWEDDGGTFMFLIESPDGFNNCCLAAIEMLEHCSSLKLENQLLAELERSMMIRIACDGGMATYDPGADKLTGEFIDNFKKHELALSPDNKVTITERIFRPLNNMLKSRFVKWRHSSELGVDLYFTAITSMRPGLDNVASSSEPTTAVDVQPRTLTKCQLIMKIDQLKDCRDALAGGQCLSWRGRCALGQHFCLCPFLCQANAGHRPLCSRHGRNWSTCPNGGLGVNKSTRNYLRARSPRTP